MTQQNKAAEVYNSLRLSETFNIGWPQNYLLLNDDQRNFIDSIVELSEVKDNNVVRQVQELLDDVQNVLDQHQNRIY